MKNQITLNEPIIIFFLTFLVYGVLGVSTPDINNLNENILNTLFFGLPIILYIISLYLFRNSHSKPIEIDLPAIKSSNIYTFFLILILSIYIFSIANVSLSGDSLYYSHYGFIHSLTTLPFLYAYLPSLIKLDVSFIIRVLSFLILLGSGILFFIFFKLQKFSYVLFCLGSTLVLIFLRYFLSSLGGNPVVHSPFSGSYLMIFGTIFGLTDLTLKASYFVAFLFFGYFLFHRINKILDRDLHSLLITSALMSLPAFFFLGISVEPAIWTVICYSTVMIILSEKNFQNYRGLVYLVLFFAFFRLPAVFALLPIFLHFILRKKSRNQPLSEIKKLFYIFLPILTLLPFFLFSILEGSAATSESNYSLSRFFSLIWNGEIFYYYADVISPAVLVFTIFLILINIKSAFTFINLTFFLFLSYVYFSINEELWSFSKYRIEAFVPLLISQSILTLRNFHLFFKRSISIPLFAMLLIFNLNIFYSFKEKCITNSAYLSYERLEYETKYGCNLLSEVPFKFEEPLKIIKERQSLASTFIPGVHYGVFTHVLQGISLEDFIKSKRIWDQHAGFMKKNYKDLNFSTNAHYIDSNKNIDFVLLGFVKDLPLIKSNLISLGWTEIYSSSASDGLDLYLLERTQ